MTGQVGLVLQLGCAEIVAQALLARTQRRGQPLRRVVFMGSGEPAQNLDNVLRAIYLLGTAGGIGHKDPMFSTVDGERAFEQLQLGRLRPALSLHQGRTAGATAAACAAF